jgi:hypothetical protein
MVSYGLEFLSLKKFFLECEILHEYIFVEIGFQIFGASCFVDKLVTMLHLKYIFLLHNRVQFLTINSKASFLQVEGTNVGNFNYFFWYNYFYCIISLIVKTF